MKQYFRGEEFSSKAKLKVYVRRCLFNNPDQSTLAELFARHPNFDRKAPNGPPERFKVETDRHGHPITFFWQGEAWEDFSWNKCVNAKERSPWGLLMMSMREEIKPQIDSYRASVSKVCYICNTKTATQWHVDHVIPFRDLVQKFNQQKQLEWIDYHAAHAKLNMACKDCNLTKG